MKKIVIAAIITAALVAVIIWAYIESSKPSPGEQTADLGREHIPVGSDILGAQAGQGSNPPTSGKHYPDWIRAGIYQDPQDDGYLIHSLEHGYIILSYNCDDKSSGQRVVYTHGVAEKDASPSAKDSTTSATLSEKFKSEECHKLVDELIKIYEKKGKKKLIVIPRPNMNTKIALTAWRRLDKLDEFDQRRIERFIDAHLNQGPEKTVE